MSIKRIRKFSYPKDDLKEWSKRLYRELSEEMVDRIKDFDFLQLSHVPWVDTRTYGGNLQAAINSNASTILLSEGIHEISSKISISPYTRRIIGMGHNLSESYASPITQGSVIRWTGAANGTMFSAYDVHGLVFENIVLDGATLASIGMSIGSDTAHPQFINFRNVRMTRFAVNGTDAALDLTGGKAFGVAEGLFKGCIIAGGAVGVKINSQQMTFLGGAFSGATAAMELGDNAFPKFLGVTFASPESTSYGETAIGIRTTVGIAGFGCHECWFEGINCALKRLDAGAAVGAYQITFLNPMFAISSIAGTDIIDTTNLSSNIIQIGGKVYPDSVTRLNLSSGTVFTLVGGLQSGVLTYTGSGKFIDRDNSALPTYANNAAAVAAGLSVGNFYRDDDDPDKVCVVH